MSVLESKTACGMDLAGLQHMPANSKTRAEHGPVRLLGGSPAIIRPQHLLVCVKTRPVVGWAGLG